MAASIDAKVVSPSAPEKKKIKRSDKIGKRGFKALYEELQLHATRLDSYMKPKGAKTENADMAALRSRLTARIAETKDTDVKEALEEKLKRLTPRATTGGASEMSKDPRKEVAGMMQDMRKIIKDAIDKIEEMGRSDASAKNNKWTGNP